MVRKDEQINLYCLCPVIGPLTLTKRCCRGELPLTTEWSVTILFCHESILVHVIHCFGRGLAEIGVDWLGFRRHTPVRVCWTNL
jgi:hypothetical protein